ncbi:long-chain fatty acid--CoA ligase [Mycobacterium sp. MAA66]|uniref:AMP-dependent synthetase/ligase n=1 Tax=Mycobacterium sp. MAA66 TaxID=3156297 RepID=UPI003518C892
MTDRAATVLADRARIQQEIAAQTMPAMLARTAADQSDAPAYSDRHDADPTGWRTLTWKDMRDNTLDVAAGLIELGVNPGDRVCIMGSNRIEYVLADSAALHAGAIPVSIYATLAPSQITWYARQAAPTVVVLEGAAELQRWTEALADDIVLQSLRQVVVIDDRGDGDQISWSSLVASGRLRRETSPAELDERVAGVQPDDPVTILFTSGTTGDPKGVVLTHANVLYEAAASAHAAKFDEPGITLSYLPFAHIAERMLGLYVPQVQGGHVHLIGDPGQLVGSLVQVRPTRFFGVPRVWEKIMTAVSARLAAETDEARKAAVADAMTVGRRYVESLQNSGRPSAELAEQFARADSLVLRPMRALLGLDRAEWTVSAAAPMPPEVANFFAGLGLRMLDVYGMSETTSAVAAGTNADFRLGTVGKALPGVEVVLAEDGEILTRGPVTTPGYYRNPDATAGLVDADGWVHTGDIGSFDAEGYLQVVDRKKEMIITSSGKNIAPSAIENRLKESPLIGHAMVVGDGRSYLVALLTLDAEIAPLLAARLGIGDVSIAALAADERILAQVRAAVEATNGRVSRPEQIKAFELLPVEWTAESAELTPTLKLKRRVVAERYAEVIDALYQRDRG